jgi:hypothetical protein
MVRDRLLVPPVSMRNLQTTTSSGTVNIRKLISLSTRSSSGLCPNSFPLGPRQGTRGPSGGRTLCVSMRLGGGPTGSRNLSSRSSHCCDMSSRNRTTKPHTRHIASAMRSVWRVKSRRSFGPVAARLFMLPVAERRQNGGTGNPHCCRVIYLQFRRR